MTYLRNISTTNADTDVPSARAFTRAASRHWHCNRPAGHTGRHAFTRRHVQPGLVRAVWGRPDPTPRPREVPC